MVCLLVPADIEGMVACAVSPKCICPWSVVVFTLGNAEAGLDLIASLFDGNLNDLIPALCPLFLLTRELGIIDRCLTLGLLTLLLLRPVLLLVDACSFNSFLNDCNGLYDKLFFITNVDLMPTLKSSMHPAASSSIARQQDQTRWPPVDIT